MQLADFTSRSWKDLTYKEWDFLRSEGIVNGCGGGGTKMKQKIMRWIIKWILKRLRLVFIQASCDVHDFAYWQGGDDRRRYECDMGFFVAIISDIQKANLGMFSVLKYTTLALCFYYTVRFGGKGYFNYH